MNWKMITAITALSHPGMGHRLKKEGVKEFTSQDTDETT